jgi:4-hydroxysphinganine ceramide fatty acyl 2-hydroxylase
MDLQRSPAESTSQRTAGSILATYSSQAEVMEEVKRTGRKLVIYDGAVYDVAEFLEYVKHPGGNNLIEEQLGTDITEKMEEAQHSPNAYRNLAKYKIGIIKTSVAETSVKKDDDDHKQYSQELIDAVNRKINLKKAVLHQIYKANFTLDEYMTFIHDPKLLNDPPRDLRIFESNFLEFFSRTPWYVIPIFWFPLITFFVHFGYSRLEQKSIIFAAFLFTCGFFSWTLVEYILHRFLFHFDERLPRSNFGYSAHFLIHGIHHGFPQDRYRLVFPIAFGLVIAAVLITFYCVLLGTAKGLITMAGFGSAYVLYDVLHYSFHHVDLNIGIYKRLKAYHNKHHYKEPALGFGVTSPLWDLVFRTNMAF